MRVSRWVGGAAVMGLLLLSSAACRDWIEQQIERAVNERLAQIDRTGTDPGKPVYEPKPFVNWETPHVSPLDLSADGARVFAVNTADNALEIFAATETGLSPLARVAVGLDPVTVRVRDENEVWVVNHVSDSISIVDLATLNVRKTLFPGDEPTDVGFAAGRAFVVCSQLNEIAVYDLNHLDASPRRIPIEGEDPRALTVSRDGRRVYVAIFESGNATTIVPIDVVSDPNGPYGGQNPPPSFKLSDSEATPAMASAPAASLIVRKDAAGAWRDDNGADWSAFVSWDVHDHDLAIIDAQTLNVTYARGLMNLNMQLAEHPDGRVTVVGTDAINHIRFEAELRGRFVHHVLAFVDPNAAGTAAVTDLNPHLAEAYATEGRPLPLEQRALSLADPRAITWTSDGQTGYVAGQGSGNVIKIGSDGERRAVLNVGAGPTGLRLDETRGRLYVLNKFDASISIVDTTAFAETGRTVLFDPTPPEIRAGRLFFYDARRTSGLGVTACAACHVDARMDQLAWDMGDPFGGAKPFDQDCDRLLNDPTAAGFNDATPCEDFHPLKGPMTTQTLQGALGTEPLHWRGDRGSLAEFNPAFVTLNGNDHSLNADEMAALQAFLATVRFSPNPYRNLDNSLPAHGPFGDAARGHDLFIGEMLDGRGEALFGQSPLGRRIAALTDGIVSCNRCHQSLVGTSRAITPGAILLEPQGFKVPQLRNLYEKTGFRKDSRANNRGFGYSHDGAAATLEEFLSLEVFNFDDNEEGAQKRRDVIAFLMAFSTDTHAGVGAQVTLDGTNNSDAALQERLDRILAVADAGEVGLVVQGRRDGVARGYAYLGQGVFQADRAGEQVSAADLRAAAAPGAELTWMLVPFGSQTRIGIDRDGDGVLNGDK